MKNEMSRVGPGCPAEADLELLQHARWSAL